MPRDTGYLLDILEQERLPDLIKTVEQLVPPPES